MDEKKKMETGQETIPATYMRQSGILGRYRKKMMNFML